MPGKFLKIKIKTYLIREKKEQRMNVEFKESDGEERKEINGGQKWLHMVVRVQPLAQQVPKLLTMGRKRGTLYTSNFLSML